MIRLRLGADGRRHHVVELRHVAAHHAHLLAEILERGGAGVDVHADDLLAARRQQADHPRADEPGAADDEDRHVFPSHGCPGFAA